MPFAAPSMSDEERMKAQDKNGAADGGVNISGESGSFATGVPGQEASKVEKGSGSKFANIQGYLDANKEQGDQMGQKIQADTVQKADDATNKVQSFGAGDGNQSVQAYDPNAAYQNATKLTPEEKDAYNKAKQGYQGPKTLDQASGYQDAQKAVSQASGLVSNAGTAEGQQALLKQTYARPDYNAGMNALDQSVMQNSAGAKKGFEDITQKYSGLNKMFDSTAQNVGNKINQNISTGFKNQQAIGAGEANARSSLVDPIRQRMAEANKNNPLLIDRVTKDASDDTLSAETMASLGLSEGSNLLDMNLQKYINPNHTQVGMDNAATAEERQKYAALSDLVGDKSMNEITSQGKAINPISFNKEQFDKDYTQRDAEVNKAMNDFSYGDSSGWRAFTRQDEGKNGYEQTSKLLDGGLGDMLGKLPEKWWTDPKHNEAIQKIVELQQQGALRQGNEEFGYNLGRRDVQETALDAFMRMNNQYKDTNVRNNIGKGRTDRKIKKG